jgi:hypothetical protein
MFDERQADTRRWARMRRSQRIDLNVPVVVYRPLRQGPQFYESTETLVVSAHGALMALTGTVAPKQRLIMQNTGSGELQECHVVYVEKIRTGPTQVAVEFIRPTPSFWHIAFPPADWTANA